MQDIHALGGGGGGGGGGGRLFGGGGDRRLRPHHHPAGHQALKCPRCDSANTKFCYYNNYNLSQPRHFCKSCRRYWTKGGVLRNVPVGGGCRKTKRNKPKSSSSTPNDAPPREAKTNSHSSSESSSLTATTTTNNNNASTSASAAATATEVVSATSSANPSSNNMLNFTESAGFFMHQATAGNQTFDQQQPLIGQQSTDGQIFPEIGNFSSLITSSNDQHQGLIGFSSNTNLNDISTYRLQQDQQPTVLEDHQVVGSADDELKLHDEMAGGSGFLDQTGQIEFPPGMGMQQSRATVLDWQTTGGGGDHQEQGLYDFTGTVDQAYWSQPPQCWPSDNDHSLNYLP